VIAHAVRLDRRCALSDRDVEERLADRGLTVSDDTVRHWVAQCGAPFADP